MGITRKDIFNCEVAALPSFILSDFFCLPNEINLLKSHLYNKLRDLWKKGWCKLLIDKFRKKPVATTNSTYTEFLS